MATVTTLDRFEARVVVTAMADFSQVVREVLADLRSSYPFDEICPPRQRDPS
jgi:hypothetical protein